MSYGIRCAGHADGSEAPELGWWVKEYDPDAYNGVGEVLFTDDLEKAIHFKDVVAAMEFYRQVSKVRPTREDGLPNRPLTAMHACFEKIPTDHTLN